MHRASNDTGVSSLTLSTWSSLELHRAVASAGIEAAGGLNRVGGLTSKVRGASENRQVVAFAVHEAQVGDFPASSHPAYTPIVVGATTLPALALAIEQRTASAYGPVVALPRVLVQSDHVGPGDHWSKSFDYRSSSFCRFEWLDAVILEALRAEPEVQAERAVPPPGVLCKYARKGYLHVLGSAGCGKTSWALDWIRQSSGEAMLGPLPPLAGWYFARRDGENTLEHGDEYSALQNLISLARRHLDVLPRPAGTEDRPGTPLRLLSDDEWNAHRSKPGPDTEDPLRQRFVIELRWLA